MVILGHGIDIVSVARVRRYLHTRPGWAEGIFSDAERRLAGVGDDAARYYAGRFAAKEAVAKALGTGFGSGVTVDGIEVLRLPSGAPYIVLSGETLSVAERLGVSGWRVSISRCGGLATASVIAIADGR